MTDTARCRGSLRLGCCVELLDSLVEHYLTPIARCERVAAISVIRSRPLESKTIPKTEELTVRRRPKAIRMLEMLRVSRRLIREDRIDAFVSFNPNPYGLIAALATLGTSIPFHLGFIGSDWYVQTKSPLGRLSRPLVRRAQLVTATGKGMRQELIHWGIAEDRVSVLPHGVDLQSFPVADPAMAKWDFVFVGQLIPRKRVDQILQALRKVVSEKPSASLVVVGDGPERARLEETSVTLGLRDNVTFVGYRGEVQPFLAASRVIVMASEVEGFPFALVEAMASGLVPVSTWAGSIGDVIRDNENGLLVRIGDPEGLANAMNLTLKEPSEYDRLRSNVLAEREQWGYGRISQFWSEDLDTLFGWSEGSAKKPRTKSGG